ncbi:LIC12048 family lipoprotein [Leptospira haakeii]|uniref:Lipoprotein n=1 Tax=Leptospira haakeii TaxID=2023198 RepID=A0ABX4PMJ7_9LEPT|nr:LIC12048 family lipoprotein [Leptospira haakeii]PKA16516.1 hypothetical protein CH363_06990 [Leptospira haakeii]PKA20537.1 hypothetical protein CH377_06395 [Leptospira haakeii]
MSTFAYFKKILKIFLSVLMLSTCSGGFDWSKRGDVDLSKATWLVAKTVPLIIDKGGIPGAGPQETPVDNLFNVAPGTKIRISSLGGAIDPTGTNIVNDFDGDGILNSDETTTNVWVADYPIVETVIAPPVTMKVTVEKASGTITEDLTNEVNSDDFESGKSQGTEKIHQSELNLKTVQFQDQYSSSSENDRSVEHTSSADVTTGVGPVQTGMNYSATVSASWESKNALSTVTTKWADRPFKNNLDSDALNLKANSSSQKARKYRADRSEKTTNDFTTKSDGGYVRAALYIKNNSVNMPVKLTNILCSLMFETASGELIPVRSFELYKADGSLFEVEVYGGTEFGPYVIENIGLNAYEVERAIAFGYTPKIFIVDYKMTHVKDSNYKSVLLNFTGDNLKIIEENSKGRTALVKVIGPNLRELYRVAAFEAQGESNTTDICKVTGATSLSPGITMEKALNRLKCSGIEIDYQDYVLDFSDIAPSLGESKLYIRGIKSFAGIESTVPCTMVQNVVGSDGQPRDACVQNPIAQWSENDKNNAGVWVIYSKGKYYSPTTYYMDGTGPSAEPRRFDGNATNPTLMVKGIASTIWAGDSYDIVYVSLKDLILKQKQFGTNPLETGNQYRLNTTWDIDSLGDDLYYPNKQSLFLGDAGFGEKLQLKIKLDSTKYLTPNFGVPENGGLYQYFTNFTYTPITTVEEKFKWAEAMDFEISLGFGGTRSEWMHVIRDVGTGTNDPSEEYKLQNCGRTLDFNTQDFFLCLVLPKKHPFVDASVSLIKLYIRPSLNNAYRKSIWPLRYSEVRKIQGDLYLPASAGDTNIYVSNSSLIADGGTNFQNSDQLRFYSDPHIYTVLSAIDVRCEPDVPTNLAMCKKIAITPSIISPISRTSSAYVYAGLTSPPMRLTVENGFFDDWNSQYSTIPLGQWVTPQYVPLVPTSGNLNCANTTSYFFPSCLGFSTDFVAMNWMGNYNYGVAHWNSWTDRNKMNNFITNGGLNFQTNTSRIFKLEVPRSDISFGKNSLAQVPIPTSDPVVITTQDGQILNIWKSGSNLIGRVYNIKTGIMGPYAQLNTAGSLIGKFVAKQGFDGSIFILYEPSFTNLIVLKVTIGSDNSITTQSNTITTTRALTGTTTSYFDIASGGPYSLVVWNHSTSASGGTYWIKGKLINSSGAAVNASEFNVSATAGFVTSTANSQIMVVAEAVSSSRVVVTYAQLTGTTSYAINSINCDDIATPGGSGSTPTFNAIRSVLGTTTGTITSLFVGGLNTGTVPSPVYRGFIAWLDGAGVITGRGLNLDTSGAGNVIGSNTTLVDATGGANSNFKLTVSQVSNYGLLTYSKSNSVYVRSVNIATSALNGFAILMNLSTPAIVRKPITTQISLTDGTNPKFIVSWEHTDSVLNKKSVRARIGNFLSVTPTAEGSSEILVSMTNDVDQTGATVSAHHWTDTNSVFQSKIFFSWLANNVVLPEVRGYLLDFNYTPVIPYGSNNFFIAPLVEREYLLKAQLSF